MNHTSPLAPASSLERAFKIESDTIAYWVDTSADADAPWLVFLPGLTADHTLFDAQMAHFSGKANCLVWDAPAHGKSRPYPLDFTMDDYAHILHNILGAEDVTDPVLVGQSLGGYVSQAFIELYPGEASGFISVDSAPLKMKYYSTWEVKALRHTKGMYQSIPWAWLKPLGSWGAAVTVQGKASMRAFMEDYTKREYVELAAYGYRMLADAIESGRATSTGHEWGSGEPQEPQFARDLSKHLGQPGAPGARLGQQTGLSGLGRLDVVVAVSRTHGMFLLLTPNQFDPALPGSRCLPDEAAGVDTGKLADRLLLRPVP